MTLKVENLSKAIEGTPILANVSFEMTKGSVIGLVGRNGAGKTTLMRLIAGEMQGDSGTVILGDKGRETIFYLDTQSNWMTAYTADTAAAVLKIFYPKFDLAHFKDILATQNLSTTKPIASFSKGQKVLIYIAAGIASQAEYLLFDEPLDGLDVFIKDYFKQILLEAVDNCRAVMIATHNLAELDSLADRILLINDTIITEQDNEADIVKIQFVYEGDKLPSNLTDVATILENRGRVYVALISEELVSAIFADSTTYRFVEILPVTTEDVFRKELGGV
ncbi:ABC transporter ATP-binding protein [Lactococcus hodotermopsidis]|uniref:ABC transporter ATP-binding protein n=1 Tax=Pseudolactococcus hodotermopsidis TaxID=2709157 RepID=A0A6A0BBT7_9LACT|nr:ATP-binding cassette domain-containing protein [Lactococcus hodotermopsidis]GFH42909.1 ABC transporter ATP-binding protein [Lactococcus hodotermopsidis]